jgi:hypothetical protein
MVQTLMDPGLHVVSAFWIRRRRRDLVTPDQQRTTPQERRVAQHPGHADYRFRSGPQTTPVATRASISPCE